MHRPVFCILPHKLAKAWPSWTQGTIGWEPEIGSSNNDTECIVMAGCGLCSKDGAHD